MDQWITILLELFRDGFHWVMANTIASSPTLSKSRLLKEVAPRGEPQKWNWGIDVYASFVLRDKDPGVTRMEEIKQEMESFWLIRVTQ